MDGLFLAEAHGQRSDTIGRRRNAGCHHARQPRSDWLAAVVLKKVASGFANDASPGRAARLVDGLLASPHFERALARPLEWTTARYADHPKAMSFQEERRYAYARYTCTATGSSARSIADIALRQIPDETDCRRQIERGKKKNWEKRDSRRSCR
jgi:hypothetical protein